ncbi:hypothetical protein WJX73_007092 [Symbiochloris irregularis]|uniref:Uncharacterized protein n=1 Tax=Symbiochloris irregularis TaxID=706552 RepID=A0AAW1PRP0_9CHLO
MPVDKPTQSVSKSQKRNERRSRSRADKRADSESTAGTNARQYAVPGPTSSNIPTPASILEPAMLPPLSPGAPSGDAAPSAPRPAERRPDPSDTQAVLSDGMELIFCQATHKYLPERVVSGTRLFQRSCRRVTRLVGLEDIDGVENGLLWFRPVEWCFYNSRVVWVEAAPQQWQMKLLDPSLKSTKLVNLWLELEARKHQVPSEEEKSAVQTALQDMTMGDLEGTMLQTGKKPLISCGQDAMQRWLPASTALWNLCSLKLWGTV